MQVLIREELVDIPNNGDNLDCPQKVAQAIANHTAVPVSNPRCAAAMNRVLELQRAHPESEPEW
jgi:hypothetical protein